MILTENKMKPVTGQIKMILHEGGELVNDHIVGGKVIKEEIIQNLIVDKASMLMAARMAPGAVTGSGTTALAGDFLDHGLQYLALGVGQLKDPSLAYDKVNNPVDTSQWDLQDPPAETLATYKLVGEFYRKPFSSWCFVAADGSETTDLTNILKITTTFYEDEANGPLTEMGLFGGDAQDWNNGAGKDSGYMFNYKTYAVWNKISTSRLSVVWKLTF